MDIIREDCIFILKEAPVCWECLRDSRILITGGTGYYGKWFLKSFLYINEALSLNAHISVISRSPELFLKKYPEFAEQNSISFIQSDVRNLDTPYGRFDYLIHAATDVATNQEKDAPDEMLAVARYGTERILKYAKQVGVKKLLLTSSGAVYGIQPPDLDNMPETYQGMPTTIYGKAKKISENLCLESDINCTIARCYASVGPWLKLDIQYAVGNFILNLLNDEPIKIKSDGRPLRSYIYIADLMIWLWTILLNGDNKQIYNVGGNKAISIKTLANLVASVSNKNLTVLVQGQDNINLLPPRYVPDTSKAMARLGLKYNYTLNTGIQRTIEWHRQRI
ncbi:NAD(P)-dependent oxidoreductase [uncultured Cloacibacillus sp.]|uniref:NAD-dependent epimerase/dehydratase family protein n=1 Tax=uncultured Cloacibacillus sp. TaxID=889794 RepID=UPI00258485D6|nr:NAD(P)-dependent oxidoreductase [uncultured Cloacibacillus sp.]